MNINEQYMIHGYQHILTQKNHKRKIEKNQKTKDF